MDVNRIVSELDTEIARLQKIREALTGLEGAENGTEAKRRGRPKGSKNVSKAAAETGARKKRELSPEGRKRIADAMKKRWAERRKDAGKA